MRPNRPVPSGRRRDGLEIGNYASFCLPSQRDRRCYISVRLDADARAGNCEIGSSVSAKPSPVLEGYSARLRAPYAVLAIRTRREQLVEIEYLPKAAATLKPIDAFAREVCRQLSAYLRDPNFSFDLPCEPYGTQIGRASCRERVYITVDAV